MTMPIDLGTESLPEPVAPRDTAISCLVRLGARNGVNLQFETVRRRAALDSDTITASRLIKLADECGLQAEWTRLDWQGLKTRGFSQLLIFREDTNAVVLNRRRAPRSRGGQHLGPASRRCDLLWGARGFRERLERSCSDDYTQRTGQGPHFALATERRDRIRNSREACRYRKIRIAANPV